MTEKDTQNWLHLLAEIARMTPTNLCAVCAIAAFGSETPGKWLSRAAVWLTVSVSIWLAHGNGKSQ